MINTIINKHSDWFGAFASGLCLIHCAATPFLFMAKACSATTMCCNDTPIWWQSIDYIFILISFIAIYFSTKNSTKKWVKTALWCSWMLLLLTILSEKFETGLETEPLTYFSAFAIVGLHIYNIKYCKCSDESCCTNQEL